MDLLSLRKLTPAAAYANARAKNLFDQMFEFIRNRPAPYAGFWSREFYVAEDPESSKSFGNKLVEFKLNPQGRLLPYSQEVREAALKEVGDRYPAIAQACTMTMHTEMSGQFNEVLAIIMEDSGVEIIDYNEDMKWFQVTSPTIFRGVRLVQ